MLNHWSLTPFETFWVTWRISVYLVHVTLKYCYQTYFQKVWNFQKINQFSPVHLLQQLILCTCTFQFTSWKNRQHEKYVQTNHILKTLYVIVFVDRITSFSPIQSAVFENIVDASRFSWRNILSRKQVFHCLQCTCGSWGSRASKLDVEVDNVGPCNGKDLAKN